jgi:hypothetical protein
MFDRFAWRRDGCEHYLLDLDDEEELDDEEFWVDLEEQHYQADFDDDETPMGDLARIAADVEAGRVDLPPSPMRP